MLRPTSLRADYETGTGYLRYRTLPSNVKVARNARISDDVVVDYNDLGEILGIELLALDDEALSVARGFAAANGLAFPLAGAAAQPAYA